MDITLSDEQDDPLPTQGLAELAAVAMEAESLPSSTQLSITLVGRERMAELNSQFMGKEGPTDVLSFPIEDFAGGVSPWAGGWSAASAWRYSDLPAGGSGQRHCSRSSLRR